METHVLIFIIFGCFIVGTFIGTVINAILEACGLFEKPKKPKKKNNNH